MLDILTFDLDDMGAGGSRLLAILAIVLTAIMVIMVRDLVVWFERLGSEAMADAEEEPQQADTDALTEPRAASFKDRRNPANPATGFGRRQSDTSALSPSVATPHSIAMAQSASG